MIKNTDESHRKSTKALPMLAIGRISRGKRTLVTRFILLIRLGMPMLNEVAKKVHGTRAA